jgi:glycine cleavage system H protein
MENIKYSKTHEYVRVTENNEAYIGISDYAQSELGEIVFIDFNVDNTLTAGQEFGEVEAVKIVSELLSPVDCEVLEVNELVNDSPEVINSSAEEDGWLLKVKLSDVAQLDNLMDEEQYKNFCKH